MADRIRTGFICAGLSSILGVLGSSMAFTNPHIATPDPTVMSNFWLAVIILWGPAYLPRRTTGDNDILFAVFFAYAFLRASKESEIKTVI